MDFVKTRLGNIPINDIPIVRSESFGNKFTKSMMFFSIIILILFIFIYLIKWNKSYKRKVKINLESTFSKQADVVKMTTIDVYNFKDKIMLENIILITNDNNVINISINTNKFIKISQIDQGLMYSIDLKKEYEIKEIILISNEFNYIKNINIDMFNNLTIGTGGKVWSYSGILEQKQENSILISKLVATYSKPDPVELDEDNTNKKIIMNENNLALTLTEDSEHYHSYQV